ncbi:MAG: tetratricopeptide repeat protein [Mucilaginibacter sp.]
MKYLSKIAFGLLFTIVAISACNHSKKSDGHSTECISLNNRAMHLLGNYPMNGKDSLKKAISLFRQAIHCDSTNVVFYLGLVNAYVQEKNYTEEMVVDNKLLALTANDPSILMQKAMLFELMNHSDSAKEIYRLSRLTYKKRLANDPENIRLIRGLVLLKGVTAGRDSAIKDLKEQIRMHPRLSPALSGDFEFYKDFDQRSYIFRLPVVRNLSCCP